MKPQDKDVKKIMEIWLAECSLVHTQQVFIIVEIKPKRYFINSLTAIALDVKQCQDNNKWKGGELL